MGLSLDRYLDMMYGESFTLKDIIMDKEYGTNEDIQKAIRDNYIPTSITKLSHLSDRPTVILLNNKAVDISENTPLSIRFIFLNAKGVNVSNPDASYIQIPYSMKGFLMRLTLPTNQRMPEYLQMDYLIDISSIKYTVDTVYSIDGIVKAQNLLSFKNIDLEEYKGIIFDEIVTNFDKKRKEILEDYF